jgi:hypothetical protein
MTPWCADKLIEQRTADLVRSAAGGRLAGPRHQRAGGTIADRRGLGGARLSEWCGYRMINLGSRLLRPALVAGAGA